MTRLEQLSRGTLTRANSRVVATRVPLQTAERIARVAAAHRVPAHVFLRQAMTLLAAGPPPPDPEGIRSDLTKALGLPEPSSPDDVLSALKDLFAALGQPVDPLASSGEPPVQLSTLSAAERTGLAERAGMSGPERAAFIQRGMTPDQFAEAKRTALRRA